jgi:hypothetical protein
MAVKFRTYKDDTLYGSDYNHIREFLIELDSHNYHYGRWDWMLMFKGLERYDIDQLERIGIWEEDEKIVAIATYDTKLGSAYLLMFDAYGNLKEEMFLYAKNTLVKKEEF